MKNAKNFMYLIGFAIILVLAVSVILSPDKSITGDVIGEDLETSKGCGEGTILYKEKGLCWQQSTMPEGAENWEDANSYCENLVLGGHDNWRLPTLEELRKIVDESFIGIAINPGFFTDTKNIPYWTSTQTRGDFHWYVDFAKGWEDMERDFRKNYGVRCVRLNSIN